MSLIKTVVDLIDEFGRADPEQLLPHCPDATREQVIRAVQNAVQLDLIERVGVAAKVPGRRSRPLGIYARKGGVSRAPDRQLPPRGQLGHLGRVSSVFQLGAIA